MRNFYKRILLEIFLKVNRENTGVSLKLPVQSRWGSQLHCFQNVKTNEFVLETLAVSEAKISYKLKKTLLDFEVSNQENKEQKIIYNCR